MSPQYIRYAHTTLRQTESVEMEKKDEYDSDHVASLRDAILASEACPRRGGDASGEPHLPVDSSEFLLRFLVCGKGDVTKSVERHNRYWSLRRELFGGGGGGGGGGERGMFCREFDVEKCERILAARPFIVAPEAALDTEGRQLMYVRPRFLDWNMISTTEALECVWYRLDRVLASNTRQGTARLAIARAHPPNNNNNNRPLSFSFSFPFLLGASVV